MTYRLVILEPAKQDLDMAVEKYNLIRKNLGFSLHTELLGALSIIERQPLIYQKRWDDIRVLFTKRFHFAIYYRVTQDLVEVFAILHQKQDFDHLDR